MRTLVLTPWMAPHRIVSWEEAISLTYQGKATVLAEYDETVSSPSITLAVPAVIVMARGTFQRRHLKFSRLNVLTRDDFRCQFCGTQKSCRELNYDHVVPRRLGGKTVWENIVTSCYPCNSKKAGRTPEQAGMVLLRQPVRPHSLIPNPVRSLDIVPEIWQPFLPA